ncbi:MAG: hypothetical protein JXB10_11640 [Pirellulales bacterium]|nr:hypothetical protein [Pirellulales bacterium]
MHQPWRILLGGAIVLQAAAVLLGDEVRYYQAGGVTYCETLRTVQRLVTETKLQQVPRTTYKEEFYSQTRDVTRTAWTPVTSYRVDTYWVGWWNPFAEPRLEAEWTPETLWVPKSETIKMPMTCRRLVPQTEQVQVPVATQRVVTEKVVVSRVPVAGPIPRAAPAAAAPSTQGTTPSVSKPVGPIGGVARMTQDPPRYGTGWQGASPR